MSEEKRFSPERYSVLIPYRDLTRLLESAARLEEMERRLSQMDERNAAMYNLYSQLLEKIAEINRYL